MGTEYLFRKKIRFAWGQLGLLIFRGKEQTDSYGGKGELCSCLFFMDGFSDMNTPLHAVRGEINRIHLNCGF